MVIRKEPSTLIKRMGFSDKDLTTPKHDEIMLALDHWLRANPDPFKMFPSDRPNWYWHERVLGQPNQVTHEVFMQLCAQYGTDIPKPSILAELVGKLTEPNNASILIKWEEPLLSPTRSVTGFADLVFISRLRNPLSLVVRPKGGIQTTAHYGLDHYTALIEVKSSIPSLGEIIREINFYRQWCPHSMFVASPDTRWIGQLIEQGIGFITYPDFTVHGISRHA